MASPLTGWGAALIVLWPCVGLAILFATSPNFQISAGPSEGALRSTPLGGDFLQEWVAGQLVLSGQSDRLYDAEAFRAAQHDPGLVGFRWDESQYYPAVYPPFHYRLCAPFSRLPYTLGMRWWAVLSLGCWLGAIVCLARGYPLDRELFLKAVLIGSLFVPLWICFNIGHKSTWILLIWVATFVALRNRHLFLAGLIFGLLAFKPHLGWVLAGVMIVRGEWRFVAGASLTLAGLVAVGQMAGAGLWGDYLGVALGSGDYLARGGYRLAGAHSVWGAVALAGGGASKVASAVAASMGLVAIGGLAAAIWRSGRRVSFDSDRFALQFAAVMLVTFLVSPHLYVYDLLPVLLPMLLIVVHLPRLPAGLKWRGGALGMMAVMVALVGLFEPLAEATRIQASVLLMAGWLAMLVSVLGTWSPSTQASMAGQSPAVV